MPNVVVPLTIQNAVDFAHLLASGDEGFAIVAKADLTGFELTDVSDAATLGGHLPAYFLPAADFNPAAFEAAGAVTAGIAAHVALADPHTQYALESALGTAAALNVGTSALNVVQLNGSAQLPAVDGSLLTNLPSSGLAPDGSATGATAVIQPFTLGIKAGKVATLANSTNAFGLYRANGSTQDYKYDSTNGRHAFGASAPDPGAGFEIYNNTLRMRRNDTTSARFDAYWGGSVAYGLQFLENAGGVTSHPNGYGFYLGSVFSSQDTSSYFDSTRIGPNQFNPTSGNAQCTFLGITATINQTGGASGITRGIYVYPTLTAAADFRGIEIASVGTHDAIRTNAGTIRLMASSSDKIGLHGATPVAKQTITGSRGGNAALASLLTALATRGDIVDSTTA